MQHFFKIASIVLFLGFFLMPKTYSAAPILEETCCTSTETDCCKTESDKKEKPCHSDNKKEGSKDCHDCHSCASIGFFANLQKENSVKEEVVIAKSSQKISFYLSPEFSDFDTKIWQPPKII